MVRREMRRAPGLAGGALKVRTGGVSVPKASKARVKFEVDDRCRHLTTPSIWYSEKAGNWAIAVVIIGLWVAAAVQWMAG